jgi:hypothetical protein
VKRTGSDEPVWVVIHKCMETIQGIFLLLGTRKVLTGMEENTNHFDNIKI